MELVGAVVKDFFWGHVPVTSIANGDAIQTSSDVLSSKLLQTIVLIRCRVRVPSEGEGLWVQLSTLQYSDAGLFRYILKQQLVQDTLLYLVEVLRLEF